MWAIRGNLGYIRVIQMLVLGYCQPYNISVLLQTGLPMYPIYPSCISKHVIRRERVILCKASSRLLARVLGALSSPSNHIHHDGTHEGRSDGIITYRRHLSTGRSSV